MVNRTLKLGDIAEMKMGYNSINRRDIKPQSREELSKKGIDSYDINRRWLPFINIKDVREGKPLIAENLKLIAESYLDGRTMRLEPDDILLLSHGDRFLAALIPDSLPRSICSVFFQIIRINPAQHLLPAYVCWQLNRSSTMHHLKRRSVGTMIKYIPRKEIMDLQIPIPNIDIQRQVADIEEMRLRENALTQELLEKRNLMIKTKLDNLINNTRSENDRTN
ncbi:MAG: restriction endonuclease subunit S [Candidatus Portiera sp.]|nr:restriction endonuclease subunit S [Portiera sp.]